MRAVQRRLFPAASTDFLSRLFVDVAAMFGGRSGDFQAVDLGYHDFEHTLRASRCMAELFEGYHAADAAPTIGPRHFELGLAAILLHDTGYLKQRSDREGTGAKYTYTHVLRSCAVAASYLPTLRVSLPEIDGVLGAIRCTGPSADIRRLHFRDAAERLIACFAATADYLGQMSADDYPEKLPALYREFEESDDYLHVPRDKRIFQSAGELVARTPAFWRTVVQPALEKEFQGVYRYLAFPFPAGPNPYIVAIERNLARITAVTRPVVSTSA
ncbi:MAG TPA: HD domain-containing protein [Opitutaceae bacterium]